MIEEKIKLFKEMEKFFPEKEKRRLFILFLTKEMQEQAKSFSERSVICNKIPPNVKCNCGHTRKHHYKGGWCHSRNHPEQGKCGCTWFYPNDKWLKKRK